MTTTIELFYTRVSTTVQSTKRQVENFKQLPEYNNNIFADKCSGSLKFMEREEAAKLYTLATEEKAKGNPVRITVDSIDRLGRNVVDILQTIETFNNNGINVRSLKEGVETLLTDGKVNPIAQLIVSVMGSLAEQERNRINERMQEGREIAKANGKYKGRKVGSTVPDSKVLDKNPVIVSKLKKGLSVREVAKVAGCGTNKVQRIRTILKKQGELQEKEQEQLKEVA